MNFGKAGNGTIPRLSERNDILIMIEFNNVSKVYKNGTHALKNVNLKIDKGEFVFVVGTSGAGKSTMIKILLREEKVSGGVVMVNEYNLNRMRRHHIPKYRRSLGVVFQDFRLIPNLNVYENVAFALRVTNVVPREIRMRVPYVLKLLGLAGKAKSMPEQLSGGEQQRVALARALVNNPAIIIADEPTGNIDPELSFEIVELLSEINQQCGTTIVMVTHEHDLVTYFNRRVIVIEDGEVISDSKREKAARQRPAARIAESAEPVFSVKENIAESFSEKESLVDFSQKTAKDLMNDYDNRYASAAQTHSLRRKHETT